MTREEQILEYANSFKGKGIESEELKEIIRLAIIDGAKWADNHPIKPSLPSNLDEVAEEYANKVDSDTYYNDEWINQEDISNAFKAGVEWMAGQGYTKEETVYFERLCDENQIMVDLGWGEPERGGFSPGDKVIVQIRKK